MLLQWPKHELGDGVQFISMTVQPHTVHVRQLLQLFHTAIPDHPSYCLGHRSNTCEVAHATLTN